MSATGPGAAVGALSRLLGCWSSPAACGATPEALRDVKDATHGLLNATPDMVAQQVPLPPWTEAWTEAALPAPGKLLEAASLAEELLQRDAVDRALGVLQASGKDSSLALSALQLLASAAGVLHLLHTANHYRWWDQLATLAASNTSGPEAAAALVSGRTRSTAVCSSLLQELTHKQLPCAVAKALTSLCARARAAGPGLANTQLGSAEEAQLVGAEALELTSRYAHGLLSSAVIAVRDPDWERLLQRAQAAPRSRINWPTPPDTVNHLIDCLSAEPPLLETLCRELLEAPLPPASRQGEGTQQQQEEEGEGGVAGRLVVALAGAANCLTAVAYVICSTCQPMHMNDQLRVPALMPNPFAFELGRLVVGPSAMRLSRALLLRCGLDVRAGRGLGARSGAPGVQQQQTEGGVGGGSAGSSGAEASGWAMLDTTRLHDALWARIEAVLTSGVAGAAGAGGGGTLVDPARDPWVGAAELTAMALLQPALSTWAANERQRLLEHAGKAYGKPPAVLECTATAVRAMYELYDSGALAGRAASPVWERAGLLRHADTVATMAISRVVQEREGRGGGGAPELRPVGVELTCWALRAAADQVDRCRAAGAPAAVKGLEKAWVNVAEGLSEVLVLANMIASPHGKESVVGDVGADLLTRATRSRYYAALTALLRVAVSSNGLRKRTGNPEDPLPTEQKVLINMNTMPPGRMLCTPGPDGTADGTARDMAALYVTAGKVCAAAGRRLRRAGQGGGEAGEEEDLADKAWIGVVHSTMELAEPMGLRAGTKASGGGGKAKGKAGGGGAGEKALVGEEAGEELRGAVCYALRGVLQLSVVRMEVAAEELQAAARMRFGPRVTRAAGEAEFLRRVLLASCGLLAYPLAAWAPSRGELLAAAPRELLAAACRLLPLLVRHLPHVDGADAECLPAGAVVSALLVLAAHEGLGGDVRVWLLATSPAAGSGAADPATEAAVAAAIAKAADPHAGSLFAPVKDLIDLMNQPAIGMSQAATLLANLLAAAVASCLEAAPASASTASSSSAAASAASASDAAIEKFRTFAGKMLAIWQLKSGARGKAAGPMDPWVMLRSHLTSLMEVNTCDPAVLAGMTLQAPVELPRVCSNPVCDNFREQSEGALKLQRCSGCGGGVRYCGVECQRAHWRAGHKEECGRRAG